MNILLKRLIEGYLKQPYVWFLNSSADLGKTVLSEVNNVIENGAKAIMTFFIKLLYFYFCIIFNYINPTVTFNDFLT